MSSWPFSPAHPAERSGLEDSFEFIYTSEKNNETLYNQFIKTGAPMEINIDGAQKKPLDNLGKAAKLTVPK